MAVGSEFQAAGLGTESCEFHIVTVESAGYSECECDVTEGAMLSVL